MLKQKGLYDNRIGRFQTSIVTTATEIFQGMPLPDSVSRNDLIEAAVRTFTEALQKRPSLYRAIQASSKYGTSDKQRFHTALNNMRTMFQEYQRILLESEKAEFLLMLRSEKMPSSYFNESVLTYRSFAFFLEHESEKIYNRLNKTIALHGANRKKLQPGLAKVEKENDLEMVGFNQLMLHHARLRSYVNLWNGNGKPEAAFIRPEALNYSKLDREIYAELFRLLRANLILFRNKIVHDYPKQYYNIIEKKHDPATQTMWKELLEPLAAR